MGKRDTVWDNETIPTKFGSAFFEEFDREEIAQKNKECNVKENRENHNNGREFLETKKFGSASRGEFDREGTAKKNKVRNVKENPGKRGNVKGMRLETSTHYS